MHTHEMENGNKFEFEYQFLALFSVFSHGEFSVLSHGTSFYFRAMKFVPEKRQRNDIFRIQAVFNYYFAIAMPVAII